MKKNSLLIWVSLLAIASVALANLNTTDESITPLIQIDEPKREWQAPQFSDQKALGYDDQTFVVPEGLKVRVEFWKKIYSEYGTYEGVIHDEENMDRIYTQVSFKDFSDRTDLSENQKAKLRRDRIKVAKDEINRKLARFQRLEDDSTLDEADKKIYHLFDSDQDRMKFTKASQLSRLRFQLGQKDRFELGIYYSGRYIHEMEEIFRAKGLPVELTRLPFVESSFNIFAMSRVGASGIWQIMPRTGRELRLKVESRVDERNDVLKATEAAARILKSNYEMLGAWGLALTAYNHGAYGIKRLSDRMRTKDISKIVNEGEGKRFGFASSNFFSCFLAALEVEKNAKQYFPNAKWSMPLKRFEMLATMDFPYKQLIEFFAGDEQLARLYNPQFSFRVRRGLAKIPAGSITRVPESKEQALVEWFKSAPNSPRLVATQVAVSQEERTYRVHRGDTLESVAKKFQVSIQDLKNLNNIRSPRSLRAGKKLVIPE